MSHANEEPFPLHSVWIREYSDVHWVVFYICEVNSKNPCVGRRVARILAIEDPNASTSKQNYEEFDFDPNSGNFSTLCRRLA